MNPSWSKFNCRQLVRFRLPLTCSRVDPAMNTIAGVSHFDPAA
jgi:hypothetical protein